jgi:hypothetical protein
LSAVLPYLSLVCRGTVVLVFAVSAFSKLRSRAALAQFARSTELLSGLSARRASTLARIVIAGEVTVAVLASAGPLPAAGLGVAGVLLCAFTGALARFPDSGQALSCGCFGSSATATRHTAIARNVLLLGVVVVGLLSAGAVPLRWDAALVCAVAAAVLAAFLIRLDEIASLFTARL